MPRPPLAIPPHRPVPPSASARARLAELDLPAEAADQLGDFLGRLLAMNERMNLISRADPADAWDRHILDSLTLVPLLAAFPAKSRLLDLGSGGGLPGIPLAIARPDLRVTLLDATQKKARFLADVATAMELSNVTVVNDRAETAAKQPGLAAGFDVITARAVTRLKALVKWCAPFAKSGTTLLLTKGQKADEELAEAKRTLAELRLTLERIAPTPSGRIVILRKSAR